MSGFHPITDNIVYVLMVDYGESSEFIGVFDSEEKAIEYRDSTNQYVKDAYYIIKQEVNYPYERVTYDIKYK